MNVLSLFDGCSGAMQAFKNLNIKVNYFASEIDPYAIQISKKNHPEIIQLGDIQNIKINCLPPIDLVIAGFPCQDLSKANKKKAGLKGSKSGLFFDALKLLKKINPEYFIFENVATTKGAGIDQHLGITPIMINSCFFSGQLRARNYWANFHISERFPKNNQNINSILCNYDFDLSYVPVSFCPGIVWRIGRTYHRSLMRRRVYDIGYKSPCINTKYSHFVGREGYCRPLLMEEIERLQGLPASYTAGVSNTQRLKMMGNGFTIPVIEHIIKSVGVSDRHIQLSLFD